MKRKPTKADLLEDTKKAKSLNIRLAKKICRHEKLLQLMKEHNTELGAQNIDLTVRMMKLNALVDLSKMFSSGEIETIVRRAVFQAISEKPR